VWLDGEGKPYHETTVDSLFELPKQPKQSGQALVLKKPAAARRSSASSGRASVPGPEIKSEEEDQEEGEEGTDGEEGEGEGEEEEPVPEEEEPVPEEAGEADKVPEIDAEDTGKGTITADGRVYEVRRYRREFEKIGCLQFRPQTEKGAWKQLVMIKDSTFSEQDVLEAEVTHTRIVGRAVLLAYSARDPIGKCMAA
jgi:hypothetical protein